MATKRAFSKLKALFVLSAKEHTLLLNEVRNKFNY